MKIAYRVTDEFKVKDSKVLVLDRNRCLSREKYYTFTMNGKIYPYKLTHNLKWLIVDSDDEFKGNVIEISGDIFEGYADIM